MLRRTTIHTASKKIITPVYEKIDTRQPWPNDQVFYLLGNNGLFLCRNQEFFQSCVPAKNWPRGLAQQKPFLKICYPRLPRRLLELVVGFFSVVYDIYRAEAAILLIWDRNRQRFHLMVPHQKSIVYEGSSGDVYPLHVHYEMPLSLDGNQYVLGDIHSHCDDKAYSSLTDRQDETYRSGLHIVVGRIHKEPPEFHVEAVADGTRFKVNPASVLEGYHHRRKGIPPEWIKKVTIKQKTFDSFRANNGSYVTYSKTNPSYKKNY